MNTQLRRTVHHKDRLRTVYGGAVNDRLERVLADTLNIVIFVLLHTSLFFEAFQLIYAVFTSAREWKKRYSYSGK